VCSAELAREPVGGEELGPLRAMTATGAGLSLALNTAATSPYPSSAVVLQPCVSLNSQRTLQWDSVVGESYSNKKKIFKAFSTFSSSSSSSSLGATTGFSLRFPHQQRCKEKRVPLAQVRRLPFCLFSLVDVDGITTTVVRLLLFGQNFKALLLLQHHNNMLSSIIHAFFRLIGFFFFFGEIGLGLGRKGAPEDYDFWSSGVWKGDAM
jgi:hypothetical protein